MLLAGRENSYKTVACVVCMAIKLDKRNTLVKHASNPGKKLGTNAH